MELLKQRIDAEGIVLNNRVLKVDGFLNHQIDPKLFVQIGKEIAKQFSEFFQTDSTQKTEKKTSFWEKLFH